MCTSQVTFDYCKLRGRIVEKFGSQRAFADALKTSENNRRRVWRQADRLYRNLYSLCNMEAEEAVQACVYQRGNLYGEQLPP